MRNRKRTEEARVSQRPRWKVLGEGRLKLKAGFALCLLLVTWKVAPPLAAEVQRTLFADITLRSGVDHTHSKPEFAPEFQHVMPWINSNHAAVAVADVNGDGLPDLFLLSSRAGTKSALYLNRGGFRFTDVAQQWGVADVSDNTCAASDAIFGDINNDGREDLFIACYGHHKLFRNDGDHFTDITASSGLREYSNASTAIFLDYNNDGLLDILIGNYFGNVDLWNGREQHILPDNLFHAGNGGRPLLYRNNGDGTFTEVAAAAGLNYRAWTLDIGAGDIDNDGKQDLYIANDYGPDRVYRNNGDGTFSDITESAIGTDSASGMNVEFGDYNNDGLLDIFVTNITMPALRQGNMLWHNLGGSRFVNVAKEVGVSNTGWGWGGKFFDMDNDGKLDLYTVSGFVSSGPVDLFQSPRSVLRQMHGGDISDVRLWPDVRGYSIGGYEKSHLFRNDGVSFREIGPESGITHVADGRGIALADFDLDGQVDIAIANAGQKALVYRNQSNTDNHWLEVRLIGTVSNRDAIGARLKMTVNGQEQIREIDGGNGYSSQSSRIIHFGLGQARVVDTLEITWPAGGEETLREIIPDRLVVIREKPKSAVRPQDR